MWRFLCLVCAEHNTLKFVNTLAQDWSQRRAFLDKRVPEFRTGRVQCLRLKDGNFEYSTSLLWSRLLRHVQKMKSSVAHTHSRNSAFKHWFFGNKMFPTSLFLTASYSLCPTVDIRDYENHFLASIAFVSEITFLSLLNTYRRLC